MKLNLGCSDDLLDGYINVDKFPVNDKVYVADLSEPWPWPDSSVEQVRAYDIIEHLPSQIHTMNEMWRVLEPGGEAYIIVPTTAGLGAFQDPTHVSFWNQNTFLYFCPDFAEWQRFHEAYGITARFAVIEAKLSDVGQGVIKLSIVLEALKEQS